MRKILKADSFSSTTKIVEAAPVKLLETDGSITDVRIPDISLKVGYSETPMPRDPKYIMGHNPYDPDNDICYEIEQVNIPALYAAHDPNLLIQSEHWGNNELEGWGYCDECDQARNMKGFMLVVPDEWPFNAVLQCMECHILHFVDLRERG